MQVALLKNIVLVLLVLCIIWIIRVVIKKENENLLRTGLILLLLGAVFYYLQTTKSETLTFSDIRAQIKDTFFPEKAPNYIYNKEEGVSGRNNYVRYFFESPGPKLSMDYDPKTQYFHIKDVYSVNRILVYLGLPKVKAAVQELASRPGAGGGGGGGPALTRGGGRGDGSAGPRGELDSPWKCPVAGEGFQKGF